MNKDLLKHHGLYEM